MATLTFTQVKKLKCPNDKNFKAFSIDSNCSLYLVCFSTGTKLYKKRIKTGYATLGNFNELSLAEARELATNYEKQSNLPKQMKINDLFSELLDLRYPNTKENQNKRRKYKNRVSKWILDRIGDKFISEVNKDELLNALNGANLEISQRALAIYRDMLKIAKNKGAINDISFIYELLEDATLLFPKPQTGHRKIITSKIKHFLLKNKRDKNYIKQDRKSINLIKTLSFFQLFLLNLECILQYKIKLQMVIICIYGVSGCIILDF